MQADVAWLDERGSTIPIQVDGNVSFELIEEMTAAGADILVAGTSSVYHKGGTLAENIRYKRPQASDEEVLSRLLARVKELKSC